MSLLPGGAAALKAAQPSGSIHELAGCLRGRTNGQKLTIEEIGETIAQAGANG
ncbi:hypothetical protein [Nevskia sp.]|uniref:hypothetical protein n=1 Tax=Nevskia sp. TaxID=1929292 RepID=UPI0025D623CC|nr:hypothetical protein [Nevskia sp.]